MSSPRFEMSLDRQLPVLINKTQMSGDHGANCGITLLPMSCRGRAAAFARDLHTRLTNLGSDNRQDGLNGTWPLNDQERPINRANSNSPREFDIFYDLELECEGPSSPVNEYDAPFTEHTPTEDVEPPFYDVDSDSDSMNKEQIKLKALRENVQNTNGFIKFTNAFSSPIKSASISNENGNAEKTLFSPITFEGCARQNSNDETENYSTLPRELERLSLPIPSLASFDLDPEFESPKNDFINGVDETDFVPIPAVSAVEAVTNKQEDINGAKQSHIKLQNLDLSQITNGNTELQTDIIECTQNVYSDSELDNKTPEKESSTEEMSKNNDIDLDDDKPQRVRRCSSLKTGKTPPGTPGTKKFVRFADVLGLDLADVKTFMDDIPVIPISAYKDLTEADLVLNSPPASRAQRMGALTLVPLFQVPQDLTDKLEKLNVCLESARVGDAAHITICGSVRVRNLDFHKTVHIRYTMNRWKTFTDLQATYVPGSCDGFSDKFQFLLYAPCISSGQRLEIAVRFLCKGQQFWDNNSGANYCFDCLALGAGINGPAGPLHPTMDWHPSFY